MARERLYLFDTTLRDGAQTNGVDFTLADKLAIAQHARRARHRLCRGRLSRRQSDRHANCSRKTAISTATFTAFGMTRRPGRSASNDPGLAALLDAKADAICFVAKSWDYHVRVALETTDEENLASIRDSVRAAKAKGREVLLDCEHFFDGYKANPDYALACAKAAYDEGARWVVLCDTNGGTLPHEVEAIVGEVVQGHPRRSCRHPRPQRHRAGGGQFASPPCAPARARSRARSTASASAAATPISSRSSRRSSSSRNFAERFEIGVSDAALKKLAQVSRALDERLNRAPNRHAPYVGESAFATKAGIHASAIVKDPATYEHVAPDSVGNRRKLLVSDQAGRSNVLAELERIGLKVDKDDPRIARLLERSRSARRSAMPMRRPTPRSSCWRGACSAPCRIISTSTQFDVNVEQRNNARGERVTVAMAVVKVKVGDDNADLGGGRQRPGQRARRRAAQGPRQVPEIHRRA